MRLPIRIIGMLRKTAGSDLRLPSDCERLSLDIIAKYFGFSHWEALIANELVNCSNFLYFAAEYNNFQVYGKLL